jgi:hypothetical protein
LILSSYSLILLSLPILFALLKLIIQLGILLFIYWCLALSLDLFFWLKHLLNRWFQLFRWLTTNFSRMATCGIVGLVIFLFLVLLLYISVFFITLTYPIVHIIDLLEVTDTAIFLRSLTFIKFCMNGNFLLVLVSTPALVVVLSYYNCTRNRCLLLCFRFSYWVSTSLIGYIFFIIMFIWCALLFHVFQRTLAWLFLHSLRGGYTIIFEEFWIYFWLKEVFLEAYSKGWEVFFISNFQNIKYDIQVL